MKVSIDIGFNRRIHTMWCREVNKTWAPIVTARLGRDRHRRVGFKAFWHAKQTAGVRVLSWPTFFSHKRK
jgi:hypothetical protein